MDPKLPIKRTANTLIRLGGCPGWYESSLGAQVILLVLSCDGSNERWFSHFIDALTGSGHRDLAKLVMKKRQQRMPSNQKCSETKIDLEVEPIQADTKPNDRKLELPAHNGRSSCEVKR